MIFPGLPLGKHHQSLVKPVEGVYRGCVVVGAFRAAAPVIHHQIEIVEPTLHFSLTVFDPLLSLFTKAFVSIFA